MLETRPGVYFWQAAHPQWVPNDGWDQVVTSYALDDGARLLVIDPLAPPPELEELASKRETAIVLTCQWHRRDSEQLAERLGAPLYVPAPNPEDPDEPVNGHRYGPGDLLPGELEGLRGLDETDMVLWSAHHAAVIAGDTLIDRGEGLVLPLDWAAKRPGGAEPIKQSLEPLLYREVEVVLPTHGLPTDRDALERALTQP
jgi:glyoxylase-like metal-dependent hydrolase (beta-lactamase superfamily II)